MGMHEFCLLMKKCFDADESFNHQIDYVLTKVSRRYIFARKGVKATAKAYQRTNNEASNIKLFIGKDWTFQLDSDPAHKTMTSSG
ncbi:hypothetical protein TNCV_3573701 [Trichonephila clavipes]|nr:hypothetical protein TNCV_3573701 [Trichonephila clavipes]